MTRVDRKWDWGYDLNTAMCRFWLDGRVLCGQLLGYGLCGKALPIW